MLNKTNANIKFDNGVARLMIYTIYATYNRHNSLHYWVKPGGDAQHERNKNCHMTWKIGVELKR